ncbi:MAG: F0F1 ATP synthase subunit A, partial [Candidatus Omnitrophica bacterium]|nr:F0F1 ATP synthase subunit A [Candidatus Omnitrophota bacterium]
DAAHHVAEHAEHAEHGAPHVANWVNLLAKAFGDSSAGHFFQQCETIIFAVIVIGIISWFCMSVAKKATLVPSSRSQLILEGIVSWLDDLVCGVTGPAGKQATPFVGALFIYILVTNLFGLIPLQNSATAYITTTAPLALCVFFYVQYIGITKNGIWGYIYHLMGSPKDFFGYLLIPLNFPLHILGEFSKPVSLMFRLYGNVMAGHILVAVFLGLGLEMLKGLHIPIGVPLHFPFLFLEILVGLIQAFVFALLSTVYIAMMLPHDDHSHEEAHA